MTPIIHIASHDHGVEAYKCLNCLKILDICNNIEEVKFCPFCGKSVFLGQRPINKKKTKAVEIYNKTHSTDIIHDWTDFKWLPEEVDYWIKGVQSVAILCWETREYLFGDEPEVETDLETLKMYHRLYNNYSSYGIKKSLFQTVKEDMDYYKHKYNKELEKDSERSVFDEMGTVLKAYKLKIQIAKDSNEE